MMGLRATLTLSMPLLAVAINCTREHLQDVASQYVWLMATGQHDRFENLSYDMVYIENNKTTSILNGTPAFGMTMAANRSFYDTTQCKTFTEIVVTDPTHPYVIHTQMTVNSEGDVNLIDSIVTDQGDWYFNATGYDYWIHREDWSVIPTDRRVSRVIIKAAGDAYADRFNNTAVNVPLGTPCARLEGGTYTGSNNSSANTCTGFPENTLLTKRKYVIDEAMGIVDMFLGFTGLDKSKPNDTAPDSHLFRVEEGLIRYVHTASVCTFPECAKNTKS